MVQGLGAEPFGHLDNADITGVGQDVAKGESSPGACIFNGEMVILPCAVLDKQTVLSRKQPFFQRRDGRDHLERRARLVHIGDRLRTPGRGLRGDGPVGVHTRILGKGQNIAGMGIDEDAVDGFRAQSLSGQGHLLLKDRLVGDIDSEPDFCPFVGLAQQIIRTRQHLPLGVAAQPLPAGFTAQQFVILQLNARYAAVVNVGSAQ